MTAARIRRRLKSSKASGTAAGVITTSASASIRTHMVTAYDPARFYDRENDLLTPLFYRADRAMRESGFDPSGRFGPFSAALLDYNPVDLNCLLYRMEMDIASIYLTLRQPSTAGQWTAHGARRSEAINRLMWDEQSGLYFDYDFQRKCRSQYDFLTTFYPLWAGIASPEQAARIAARLPLFERAGGLQTSTQITGDQWDAPFGWAPLQLIECRDCGATASRRLRSASVSSFSSW
jgi:alpha,alpha-trehalase